MESSAAANAVNGVSSEGFITTVHPHARAGATWHQDKQSSIYLIPVQSMSQETELDITEL